MCLGRIGLRSVDGDGIGAGLFRRRGEWARQPCQQRLPLRTGMVTSARDVRVLDGSTEVPVHARCLPPGRLTGPSVRCCCSSTRRRRRATRCSSAPRARRRIVRSFRSRGMYRRASSHCRPLSAAIRSFSGSRSRSARRGSRPGIKSRYRAMDRFRPSGLLPAPAAISTYDSITTSYQIYARTRRRQVHGQWASLGSSPSPGSRST